MLLLFRHRLLLLPIPPRLLPLINLREHSVVRGDDDRSRLGL